MGSLRILHVMASHRWTGAAEPAANEACAALSLGHEVLFAPTCGHSFDENLRRLGVPVTDRVAFERSYWPHRKLREIRALHALVQDFRPDVVHAHLTHDHVLAGVALGKDGPQRPVLVRSWHRQAPPRADAFTRSLAAKRTSGGVTVSSEMGERLRETFGFGPDAVLVLPSAIDGERFSPGDGSRMRAKWGIPEGAPVAGVVSRLRPARGIVWLLKAAEEFLEREPKGWLVVCGRGSWKDEFLELLAAHPRKDRIVYAGYVEGDDLQDAYRAFDVSLLLKPGNDGGCRAALEAMACERPVIGGDTGVLRDLLGDGACGALARLDDAGGLAARVLALWADADARRRMGMAARERVLQRHSRERVAQALVDFYARVAARASR